MNETIPQGSTRPLVVKWADDRKSGNEDIFQSIPLHGTLKCDSTVPGIPFPLHSTAVSNQPEHNFQDTETTILKTTEGPTGANLFGDTF
jgi:hypothetical protein